MQTQVITVMNTIAHNKDIFEDPMAFLPDRWNRDSKKIHPFASLPFGFGPRACYGENAMACIMTSREFNS